MSRPISYLKKQALVAATYLSRPRMANPSSSVLSSVKSPLKQNIKREFHVSAARSHGDIVRPKPGTGIKVTFRDSKGADIKTIEGNEGDDLLSLAHEYDVDLEGACEGSVACSTCHVIISPEQYDRLPEPDDEENDMLDLAFGLEDTYVDPQGRGTGLMGHSGIRSRLGCQVHLSKNIDGLIATLPSATRNMYVDGAKARTH
ncbi:hypothetical protein P7C73_g56, partial [Tremellales sp. Uapishka_1]